MANIYFTQYLRPHGERKLIWIDRPDHIAKAATVITEHGFRFECEELTTGDVSMTISDDFGDYAHELSPNGPEVPTSVDKLITGFDLAVALKCREINRRAS